MFNIHTHTHNHKQKSVGRVKSESLFASIILIVKINGFEESVENEMWSIWMYKLRGIEMLKCSNGSYIGQL